MRMQIPVDVYKPDVLLHDAPHRALRQPPPRIVEKHGLDVELAAAMSSVLLFQKPFAHRPIFFQRFLSLCSVRNDALLVPFAAYSQHALLLLNVQQVQARKFANAQTRSIKQFKRSEEHTSELQSRRDLVCRLLLEKKKKKKRITLQEYNKL